MNPLPPPVREVLERGDFCHVAALTPDGPHVTPMVFAVADGGVWVTTARSSVKARAWRADARIAGLVRSGDEAVAFTGTVSTHDVLDASSWRRSFAHGPALSLAAARFMRKNARFFAGYAVDAHRVPLAWTPPGRVFAELSVERAALFRDGGPPRTWGEWGELGDVLHSAERFRASRTGADPLAPLPADVRAALGGEGRAALAIEGGGGPVVLPVAWRVSGAGLYATTTEDAVGLASAGSHAPRAALGLDRPSAWRARHMLGAMARGVAEFHVAGRLRSGAASARSIAGDDDGDLVLVHLRPERFVWWRGWRSGTVTAA
ncbi:MAG: pyridoxamine 5'-phosphate oxidase family protein [Actinomycetota bacterium]